VPVESTAAFPFANGSIGFQSPQSYHIIRIFDSTGRFLRIFSAATVSGSPFARMLRGGSVEDSLWLCSPRSRVKHSIPRVLSI
jgi:hypothetical protein